ncbi:MAG: YggU family protein [Alphaproteobacteria bacterium]|nr:YggU family protein [Alphaproteobacteria bacterium]
MQNIFENRGDYTLIKIRVSPNAKRNGFEGVWNDTHLKLALRAPAVDGKANEAVIDFLSDFFHIKKSQIEIVSGQTNRCKTLRLDVIYSQLTDQITKLTK